MDYNQFDEVDSTAFKLPNFIPQEPTIAPTVPDAQPVENTAASPEVPQALAAPEVPEAVAAPVQAEPEAVAAPVQAEPEAEKQAEPLSEKEAEIAKINAQYEVNRMVMTNAGRPPDELTALEQKRDATIAALSAPPVQEVDTPKADKAQALVGPDGAEAAVGTGVTVLPRLSDFRIEQVEKASNTYEEAHKAFWQAGGMPDVRKEIEERARVTGISVADVMEKMKPGGDMADLGKTFNEALAASPEALGSKKTMDKALEGWGRQHGRAAEELLNPEQEGSPHHDDLKARLKKAQGKMEENTADLPLCDGEEKSNAQKMQEMMQKIMDKITEFIKGVVNAVRGNKEVEADNAPNP